MKIQCYECKGRGYIHEGKEKKLRSCKRCKGNGFVELLKKEQKPISDFEEDEEDKEIFGF